MPTSMNPVAAALYTKLTGTAAITSLLDSATSVYENVAPQNADPPYIVFLAQSPSVPQYTFGGAVAWENTIYQVKAVTEGHSAAAAGTIADKIDDALNDATLTVTGYTNMMTVRVQSIDYPEAGPAGKRFNHRGGLYRVWSDPT